MKAFKQLPPAEELRAEFFYDPDLGLLLRRLNGRVIEAGYISKTTGYLQVGFGGPGKLWVGHRLIWKIVTGDDPGNMQVDHINRIRHDNRWKNLRLVDMSDQMANRGVLKTNSSRLKGAYKTSDRRPNRKPYRSSIMRNGKSVFLGYFDTAEEAHAAYIKAGGIP